jgi:hypothetical protein
VHCSEFGSPEELETPSVKELKVKVEELKMHSWLVAKPMEQEIHSNQHFVLVVELEMHSCLVKPMELGIHSNQHFVPAVELEMHSCLVKPMEPGICSLRHDLRLPEPLPIVFSCRIGF